METAFISRPATAFGEKKILIIDDEHRLAQSLASLLRGAGYQVEAATSGPSGLELVQKQPFDLIITDLRMDAIDGFDIMRHVAEHCPATSLIVITGHASTESAIEALHQRVADYIPKPFDFDSLCRSIEKVFAQQETERLKSDMVNMLTHDIKVPLTSVLGFAQLIRTKDGAIHQRAGDFAEIIVSNCQRVLSMLDNYLTNARIEEGHLETVPVRVNLRDIVEQELKLNSLEISRKNLHVDLDFQEIPDSFCADEHLLTRVVSNLISNATKYAPQEGIIRITTGVDEEEVCLSISNNARELNEDELIRMFQRYERVSSAEGIEGSGLGLHVVRSVAEAHGGRAGCRSEDGTVIFEIYLPLRRAPS